MIDVSRETAEKLRAFESLALKWSKTINLVAPSTLSDFQERHIQDSLQVFHVKHGPWDTWVDLGSGGGLPGIVVAILAHEHTNSQVTLVESDKRKATFLRTVVRELDLNAEVLALRIENAPKDTFDVISARALAPLPRLLELAIPLATERTQMIFPKGKSWKDELESACQEWSFQYDVVQSTTNPEAVILTLKEVVRA